jgi:hypothetical protein
LCVLRTPLVGIAGSWPGTQDAQAPQNKMSTITDINTKVLEAVAANEIGDYATALTKLRSARMLLAGVPDTRSGNDGLTWDRASIDAMMTEIQQQQTRARRETGGNRVRRTNITYRRPDAEDDE